MHDVEELRGVVLRACTAPGGSQASAVARGSLRCHPAQLARPCPPQRLGADKCALLGMRPQAAITRRGAGHAQVLPLDPAPPPLLPRHLCAPNTPLLTKL